MIVIISMIINNGWLVQLLLVLCLITAIFASASAIWARCSAQDSSMCFLAAIVRRYCSSFSCFFDGRVSTATRLLCSCSMHLISLFYISPSLSLSLSPSLCKMIVLLITRLVRRRSTDCSRIAPIYDSQCAAPSSAAASPARCSRPQKCTSKGI